MNRPDRHEAIIIGAISDCESILELISEDMHYRGVPYFFTHYFVACRQLVWYFKEGTLQSFLSQFNVAEQELLERITSLRIAAAHPEIGSRWLNDHLLLVGAKRFHDNDVEIQYGNLRIDLLSQLIPLFEKMRDIFGRELDMTTHSAWGMDTQSLSRVKQSIQESLKSENVLSTLRKRLN